MDAARVDHRHVVVPIGVSGSHSPMISKS